ncbi:MAG: (Fe-S)-binding protein [Acidimicrobiia bacterium]|nr:(Fe-S)-binding protein [Acidimicrobiia bacterium]
MTGARESIAPGVLGLDPAELGSCVACGLCLPHCPTFRVTGLEIASPRGRIAAMRLVDEGAAPIDRAFRDAMEACVQCRGCEAACPSSVPFGHLMESTRAALEAAPRRERPWRRRAAEWWGYRVLLPHHRRLMAATWLAWAAQRLGLVPRRAGLPRLRARSLARPLRPTGAPAGAADVYLYPGCVMDAWQRDVHRAAVAVLEAGGGSVVLPGPGGDCCGALHQHAGRLDEARRLAGRVVASMPGDAPIVVDSAGCGAAMKSYGDLLGTPEARVFSARVRDFAEHVRERDLALRPTGRAVVVQDPCHLRHVQRAAGAVRDVLSPAYELLETDDDGLCCGAGGTYQLLRPELSAAIRDRKVAEIARAAEPTGRAPVVASANPGCALHLTAAGLEVRHPAELLADALSARDERTVDR